MDILVAEMRAYSMEWLSSGSPGFRDAVLEVLLYTSRPKDVHTPRKVLAETQKIRSLEQW